MLTRILPGLRDLRTPLAVGILWLLALWLIGGGRLASETSGTGDLSRRVDGLLDQFGTGARVSAVLFASYLLGAVVGRSTPPKSLARAVRTTATPHTNNLSAWHGEATSRLAERGWWQRATRWVTQDLRGRYDEPLLNQLLRERLGRAEKAGIEIGALVNLKPLDYYTTGYAHDFRLEPGEEAPSYSEFNAGLIIEGLAREVSDEQLMIENRLLIEREQLFERYDKVRSESEFRIAIAPPLAVVVVVLASIASPMVALALFVPLALYVQGVRRYYSSQATLWQAVQQGLTTSATLEAFDEAIASSEPTE